MTALPIAITLLNTRTHLPLAPNRIIAYNQPMIKQTKKFYNDAFIEIFSHIPFVKSLLQDFIHESWVNLIDFSHMEVIKSQFIGISDDKREADLLLWNTGNIIPWGLMKWNSSRLGHYCHKYQPETTGERGRFPS